MRFKNNLCRLSYTTKFPLREFRRLLNHFIQINIAFKLFIIFGLLFLVIVLFFLLNFGFTTLSNLGISFFVADYRSTFLLSGVDLCRLIWPIEFIMVLKSTKKLYTELTKNDLMFRENHLPYYTEWQKMYKVQELNEWILVYPSKISFNAIPKKDFQFGEIENFRDQLKGMSWLKLKLKE